MIEIPDYDNYKLIELYQALNTVRADLYPEIFQELEKEIASRSSESRFELQQCFFTLDREKYPHYATRLAADISTTEPAHLSSADAVAKKNKWLEANKYKTFWRRLGAQVVDALVFVPPILIVLIFLGDTMRQNPALELYIQEGFNIAVVFYVIAMHAKFGQTVGKMAFGVKVLDVSESSAITIWQATIRNVVPLLFTVLSVTYLVVFGTTYDDQSLTGTSAMIAIGAGSAVGIWELAEIVTMLFNRKRRALHDFIARTVVVRVPQ